MDASIINSRRDHWKMQAREANGMALPPWTRSDDSDHEEYDVATNKKRRLSRRSKRSESGTDDNVQGSWLNSIRRGEYKIPGNSLRESSIEVISSETAQATSGYYQPTTTDSVYSTISEAIATATSTYSKSASSSPAATPNYHRHAHESASSDDSDGESDSGSDSNYDSASDTEDVTRGDAVVTGPLSSSTLPSSSNLMIDEVHDNVHTILLAVGTVVGFILIVSVLLIAWKFHNRRNRRRPPPYDDMSYDQPSRLDKILSKVPFIRNKIPSRNQWYFIPEPTRPPVDDSKKNVSPQSRRSRAESTFLPLQKHTDVYDTSKALQSVSTLDTDFTPPGKPTGVYNGRGLGPSKSNIESVSPTSSMFVEYTAMQAQVMSAQSPKPVPLPSQKPVLNTPKWDYSRIKRQTGISEISSISSGFGDRDIIITPNNTVATINTNTSTSRTLTPLSPVANPSRQYSSRSSRMDSPRGVSSRQSSMRSYRAESQRGTTSRQSSLRSYRTDNRRDTVSTQASIESRPRFHSVSSWVKQQSGQVRKAQQSAADSDAPPVPMLPPPEQEWRYMMPDGEEPRRVDMR